MICFCQHGILEIRIRIKIKIQLEALRIVNSTPLDIFKIFEGPFIAFSNLIKGKRKVDNYPTIISTDGN